MRVRIPGTLLTAKKAKVVALLSDGHSIQEAAYLLGISARTVESHIQAARKTTGARSVAALVATAIRNGWIA